MKATEAQELTRNAIKSSEVQSLMARLYKQIEAAAREGKHSIPLCYGRTALSPEKKEMVKKQLVENGYKLIDHDDYGQRFYIEISWSRDAANRT